MRKIKLILGIAITYICYPFLSLISKLRNKGSQNKYKILLLPQFTRIGDIVCSTPVIYNIKKSYPNSHLAVLVSKKAVGIIKNNPRIDEIIILEDYNFIQLIRKLRSEKFNYSINLSATSVNTCITLWSLISNRIKTIVETPPITERLTDWMSNHRLIYRNHTYLPQHHINLLKFMGINNPEDKKEVWTTEQTELKANNWRNNFPSHFKIIGISISAGNKIKELGDHKFKTLINKLLLNNNYAVAIIGSKADIPRIDNLIKEINNERCFKATDFNLEELPSLMKKFNLYIAVDTGPIYIAHAVGTPLIDIIGPVDPLEQPPQDSKSIRVLARNNVSPSSFVFKRRGSSELIKSALDNTNIDDIYDSAIKLLA